jgi:hypothetical protein
LGQCQTCGCNWCGRKRASRLAHSGEGSRDHALPPLPQPPASHAPGVGIGLASAPHSCSEASLSQPFSVTQCIAQCNRFRLHSALHSATVFVAQCNRECCKSVGFLNILRFFAIAQCNFFRYTVHRTLSSTVLCTSGHHHTH